MTNDLISRSALLKKSIRVTETDEGGWERVLRAVPVEEIEKVEAVKIEGNLISREAVLKTMKGVTFENIGVESQFAVQFALQAMESVVNNAPAVDAEPVKHGRWLEAKGAIRCSECMNTPLYDYFGKIKLSDVCLHCGAKMEVEHEAD